MLCRVRDNEEVKGGRREKGRSERVEVKGIEPKGIKDWWMKGIKEEKEAGG